MFDHDQILQFKQLGFVVVPKFLPRDEVDRLLAGIDRVAAGNTLADHDSERMEMEPEQPPDGMAVRRMYEPCTHYPEFRDLSDSDNLLQHVEQLLGPNLTYHYSKINMKPAQIGSVVEWHQDLSYYPLTNRDSVAILFYLDHTSQENGCLQVLPGRHTGPLLQHNRHGYFQGRLTEQIEETEATPLSGPAGSAIFMHGMTPHASVANNSGKSRRTLILSYRAADAFPIYTGEQTVRVEASARHAWGEPSPVARFTMSEFPVPKYKLKIASLYQLQDSSRKQDT